MKTFTRRPPRRSPVLPPAPVTTHQGSRSLYLPIHEGIGQPLQGQFTVPSKGLGFPGPLSDIGNIMADVFNSDLSGK